jgi:hypothetical protein
VHARVEDGTALDSAMKSSYERTVQLLVRHGAVSTDQIQDGAGLIVADRGWCAIDILICDRAGLRLGVKVFADIIDFRLLPQR